MLWVFNADYDGARTVGLNVVKERLGTPQNYRKFAKFPLTRDSSLLFYASREKAGPVPSEDSVFFSGPPSQFSAVDIVEVGLCRVREGWIFDSVVADFVCGIRR